jgi:hypothetical protein
MRPAAAARVPVSPLGRAPRPAAPAQNPARGDATADPSASLEEHSEPDNAQRSASAADTESLVAPAASLPIAPAVDGSAEASPDETAPATPNPPNPAEATNNDQFRVPNGFEPRPLAASSNGAEPHGASTAADRAPAQPAVSQPDGTDARTGVLAENRSAKAGKGGMFRRRTSAPKREIARDDARAIPPERAVSSSPAATPAAGQQPAAPRRAAPPLPWGRDFAAAVVHRDDTLNAIFGKLDAADSPRVALVAPHGNEELARPLGMRRLRRYVDHSGKDVIIVTHSSAVRARAHEVGLAVTGNVKRVDFERYGRSGVHVGGVVVPLPGLGLFVRLATIAIAVAAIVGAVLLYLPEATVTVYPSYTPQQYAADVTLLGAAPSGALASGQLAAHRRSESLSRTVLFPVHGTATVKGPDGNDQQVASPSDDDLKQADAFAQQVLLDEGRADLASRYSGETLVKQSAVLSAYTSKANAKAGEPADLLRLSVSGQVTMLSADNDALRKLLETALTPTTLRTQMFVPQTFKATIVSAGPYDKDNNQITVSVQLQESTTGVFSAAALRTSLKGKSRTGAQQAVDERVDESAPAVVNVNPGWAPVLPRFSNRITVNVATPTPSPTPSPSATPTPVATPAP